MKFFISRIVDENFDDVIKFNGEFKLSELLKLPLNSLDRAMLNSVNSEHAGSASSADYLLLLEILFRRHEEQLTLQDSVDII